MPQPEPPRAGEPEKLAEGWLKKPEKETAPAESTAEPGSVSWENGILPELEKLLENEYPTYAMLAAPANLSGRLGEKGLSLYPKNDVVRNLLDAGLLALIRQAAEKLTGVSTPVTLADAEEGDGSGAARLDQLMNEFHMN